MQEGCIWPFLPYLHSVHRTYPCLSFLSWWLHASRDSSSYYWMMSVLHLFSLSPSSILSLSVVFPYFLAYMQLTRLNISCGIPIPQTIPDDDWLLMADHQQLQTFRYVLKASPIRSMYSCKPNYAAKVSGVTSPTWLHPLRYTDRLLHAILNKGSISHQIQYMIEVLMQVHKDRYTFDWLAMVIYIYSNAMIGPNACNSTIWQQPLRCVTDDGEWTAHCGMSRFFFVMFLMAFLWPGMLF